MILTVTLNASVDKLYRVDCLSPHQVMRVKEVNNTAGGKGMNVSRVAALAGERVVATGFAGGWNGRLFESLIAQANIEPCFIHTSAETRCCINILDAQTGGSTEFLEPGQPVREEDVNAFLEQFRSLLPAADAVVMSGSMPGGLPKNFYAQLTALAKAAGKKVLLDTSGEALHLALEAKPDFIKPNTDELSQLMGKPVQTQFERLAAARRLHALGVHTVAVSEGKDGVLVVSETGVYHGMPPEISAVNTVGCGDSMVAGFAVGLARGLDLPECIRFAVAISAANALTRETGSFRTEDLRALLPQVRVQALTNM